MATQDSAPEAPTFAPHPLPNSAIDLSDLPATALKAVEVDNSNPWQSSAPASAKNHSERVRQGQNLRSQYGTGSEKYATRWYAFGIHLGVTPPVADGPVRKGSAWQPQDQPVRQSPCLVTPAAPKERSAAAKRKAAQRSRQSSKNTSPAKDSKPKSQRTERRHVAAVGSAIATALNNVTSNHTEQAQILNRALGHGPLKELQEEQGMISLQGEHQICRF